MKEKNITHVFSVGLTEDQTELLTEHFPQFWDEMQAELISKVYELLALSAKQEIE
jgi:hypothetical protein